MRGRGLAVVALSASLALPMVACGDDDEPVTTAGGQPTETTAAPATTTAPATTAAPATTGTTAASVPTVATRSSSLGTILVDADGMTLYTWDRDSGPTSSCTGGCATTWPPLVVPAGSTPVASTGVGDLTTSPRPDDPSRLQVVWEGQPLYTYTADTAPGDVKGDGVGGTWHVAKVPA